MQWCNNWSKAINTCLDYIENNGDSTVTEVSLKVTKAEELIQKYKDGCRSKGLYDEMLSIGKEIEE